MPVERTLPELLEDMTAVLRAVGPVPLYVDDRTLHRLVAPHLGADSWKNALRELEREGFPKAKDLWRGRYWPACLAWLDNKHGVRANVTDGIPAATAEDGQEDFDAAPGRKARSQDRTQRAAVLDREPGHAQPAGRLSGQVHRLADRRHGR